MMNACPGTCTSCNAPTIPTTWGALEDLYRRVQQHNAGEGSAYTRRRLPVELVYSAYFDSVAEAFGMEKRVQNWSRAKRQALIDGDFDRLPALAKKPRRKRTVEPPGGPSTG
ncbi:GIY-YIG nuclease family protein [Gordonia iterans]